MTRRGVLGSGAVLLGSAGLAAVGIKAAEDGRGGIASGVAPAAASSTAVAQAKPGKARGGRTREYWVQVDAFSHNLVPTGSDQLMGRSFKPSDSTYWGLGYRAFTPSWGEPLPGNDDLGPNTGIPGPILRAGVGDTVLVHFRNNDTHYNWPHSMHPHGLKYDPASDGAYVASDTTTPGRAVPVGQSYTYTWTAQPSSVGTWPYHDHSIAQGITPAGPVMEFNAQLGMFGLIAVTDHATPAVDREFFLFFHDLYQADIPSLSQDFDSFNGAAYLGNTPSFEAMVGDRVRWRVAALGKEFHVFHLHGHRWKDEAGRYTDSQLLGPSTTLTVEFTEDNPGDWLYHCHVTDHMDGGMVGWYRVSP
ncbi:MAG TPA: multicopper oxidase domain-containing protein [Actinomycetota bacterium]|nr:multicopper oxidase domain-containing protein [Actinomycetota bacterium]